MSTLSHYYKLQKYDSGRGNFRKLVVNRIMATAMDYIWYVTESTCQIKLLNLIEMDISAKTKAYVLHFAQRENPLHHGHDVDNPFQHIPASIIERLNENGLWKDMVRTHLLVIWAISRYWNVSHRALLNYNDYTWLSHYRQRSACDISQHHWNISNYTRFGAFPFYGLSTIK